MADVVRVLDLPRKESEHWTTACSASSGPQVLIPIRRLNAMRSGRGVGRAKGLTLIVVGQLRWPADRLQGVVRHYVGPQNTVTLDRLEAKA